jgi:hypothetical protein
MESNSDDANGFQLAPPSYRTQSLQVDDLQMPGLHMQSLQMMQGVQMQGPSFHANQAVSVIQSGKQSTAPPQMFPQHPHVMNGYYNPGNSIQMIPNKFPYKLNGESVVHYMQEIPHSFVEKSIYANQQYYGQPTMMQSPNLEQGRVIESLTHRGMVRHANGHVEHAAVVYQYVNAKHAEGWQLAQQIERIRAERKSLGHFTPPRGAKPYKRRLQDQVMRNGMHSSNFNLEASISSGQPWEFHEERPTLSQKRNSTLSHEISRSLSPHIEIKFEAPRTPQNFSHPADAKGVPSRMRRTGRAKKPLQFGRLSPGALATPLADSATSARTPFLAPAVSTLESVPAFAIAFSTAVEDQTPATFKPISARDVSYPAPTAELSEPFSRIEPDASLSSDISGPADLALLSTPGSLTLNGAQPAPPSDSNHTLSSNSSSFTAPPASLTRGISPVAQGNTGMSDEGLFFPGLKAPIAAESTATQTPAQGQDNREVQEDTVTEAGLQEIFQTASNIDIGHDILLGVTLSNRNSVLLEGQNNSENILDPHEDKNLFADYDEDDGSFYFNVSYS